MKLLDFIAEGVQYYCMSKNDPVTDADGFEYDTDLFGETVDSTQMSQ